MRFRFCGDGDCPDWILAEINNISQLSSVKLKLLTSMVARGLLKPPVEISKAEKLFSDSKLDPTIDLKACIACLSYIISSTVRYSCNSGILVSELQQLGLPREHSNSIKRIVDEQYEELFKVFRQDSLSINPLRSCSVDADPDSKCLFLNLSIGETQQERLTLLPSTAKDLLEELQQIRDKMAELNDSNLDFA